MKEILWTAREAATATGGKTNGDWQATGVSIDSRTIEKGDLFIALAGENFDGHDFVIGALAKGASAALVSRKPAGIPADAPLIIVPDVAKGLWDLGVASWERTSAKIIGVTGSVGKTGTKEAIKLALETFGKTYATAGNLNNHFGAPLSLARMPKNAKYGVFEMGMNHAGEIAALTKLIRPHVAIITTVEAVHLEFFSGVEEIADAKSEIFLGMDENGVAVLNIDNPNFARMKKHAENRRLKIITFGTNDNADFRLVSYSNNAGEMHIEAAAQGEMFVYNLKVNGKHLAMNSLGTLAVVAGLGEDFRKAIPQLEQYIPAKGRGQVFEIEVNGGKALLIDDSYNASPASCRAAFEVLAARRQPGGRTIALLGDMRELGTSSGELHANLAQDIVAHAIDLVFTAGDLMLNLHRALPEARRGRHYKDSAAMAEAILPELRNNDVVMVKGSNGSKMIKVVDKLKSGILV